MAETEENADGRFLPDRIQQLSPRFLQDQDVDYLSKVGLLLTVSTVEAR